jgi:hypothetical protein
MAPVTVAPTSDRFSRGGQPFFYLADTAWMAFSNVPEAMWTEYVRYRREQGFTALQISVLPVNHDTSVAATNDTPFTPRGSGWDYGARNAAYFDKAERMVAEVVAAGLVPVLGVLWRNYVPGTRSSSANPVAGSMPFEAMEEYVAHIAQRFRPYEPMFFISGDTLWESEDEPRYYLRALELIRAGCPDALISMHLTPQADLPDRFVDAVDFYMFQSGHDADHVDRPWLLAEKFASSRVRRPVINSEPCYEGHGRGAGRTRQARGQWTRSEVRAAAWQSLLSGAKAGVTYGGHGVWSFHTREKRFLNEHKYVPMDWWEALRLPGAWDYGYARWLFETFGLADLAPNQSLVANTDPAIRAAATSDAGAVAVYMPHAVGLRVNADLSRHRITLLDLERRRPYTSEATVSGGCTRFQLPNANGDLLMIAVR